MPPNTRFFPSCSSGIFSVLAQFSSLSLMITKWRQNSRHHMTTPVWRRGAFPSMHLFLSKDNVSQKLLAYSLLYPLARIGWTPNVLTKKILQKDCVHYILTISTCFSTFVDLVIQKKDTLFFYLSTYWISFQIFIGCFWLFYKTAWLYPLPFVQNFFFIGL